MGLFFFALPVTVVGYHFVIAHIRARWEKVSTEFETALEVIKREGVMHLLELANEALGMSMFERDDMLVFLAYSNQLNTKTKIEQILHFKNGWAYLPYAEHSNADLPRISQFKLYVLFSIYGRVFKRKREEW